MLESENTEVEEDAQFHSYKTQRIPWYVRVMWIAFWIGAIWYGVKWLIPAVGDYF